MVVLFSIGIATPLIDHYILDFSVQYFYNVQNVVRIFDYTGGPVNSDLLLVWLEYGSVLAAYVVRKLGAATVVMTTNGFVQVFVGGAHAPHLLYGVSGLAVDLVFASFRYRRYDLPVALLAGVACAVSWYPIVYFTHGVFLLPSSFAVSDFILRVFGSAIGDGLLGAALGVAIASLARRGGARLGLRGERPQPRS
ncbi:MAG: ECF transporter S component [Nitrososphaerales archaeon]|nr:ECF transporter S component [Nitrososphaerales archaeon]